MPEDKRQLDSKPEESSHATETQTGSTRTDDARGAAPDGAQDTRIALVVVGMHRSGTSAVSRILNLLGADIAKKLLPPRTSNPAGFWESKDLMILHDKTLESVGAAWDDVTYLPPFWHNNEVLKPYQEQFAEVVGNDFNGSSFFVMKDPRISRFIPLTATALEELGVSPKYVISLRNPLEVAASLKARDGFGLGKSLLLWLDHSLRAERMTRGLPRAFVLYEELLKDWRAVFRTVESDIDLSFPAWNAENEALIDAFISPKLRNHVFSKEEAMVREEIGEWVKTAYEALRLMARGQSVPESKKELECIHTDFKKAQKMFGLVLGQGKSSIQRKEVEVKEIQKVLVASEKAAKQLSRNLDELSRETAGLHIQDESSTKKHRNRERKSSVQAQKFDQIVDQISKLRSYFDTLQLKVEDLAIRREYAADLITSRASGADQFSERISALRQDLDKLRARNESALAERDRALDDAAEHARKAKSLSGELSLARSQCDAVRGEAGTLRKAIDSTTEERNEFRRKADELGLEKKVLLQQANRQAEVAKVLRQRLSAVKAKNELILNSLIWRLASPIRAMGEFRAAFMERLSVGRHFLRAFRTGGLKNARKLIKDRRLLLSSGLFDVSFYVNANRGALARGDDPLCHYLMYGSKVGCYPNSLFDTRWYLERYPDVARAGVNPLEHFILFGAWENRDPHPLFQTAWYLHEYPDVVSSGMNPLLHYLVFGGSEGRSPNPLFDGEWYLETNPAVAEAGINPLVHFVRHGWREGRNPSDRFDVEFYLENNPDVALSGINPLAHYLLIGKAEGRPALSRSAAQPVPYSTVPGRQARVEGWKTVLCVAHFVSERLFGAERSFLDILDGLSGLKLNVIAVLPKNITRYTNEAAARCSEVAIFEYDWWKKNSPVSGEVIRTFEALIYNSKVDAVHVNTLMLREPLIAASNCDAAAVVHVRELIRDDQWLTEAIGESSEEIVDKVLGAAAWVIANSEATRRAFDKKSNTFVIPNPVELEALDVPNTVDPASVRFGLISSNIRKKGIWDFVAIARACADRCPNARFVLVGPETRLIKQIRAEQINGNVPSNIEFAGYADSPRAAIEQVNVVLNLSHFKESFGRTVAEAMAARRPAITYDWGALPELVVDGVTGFLVPYRKPEMAVPAIEELCTNIGRIIEMGDASRRLAEQSHSKQNYAEKMEHAYQVIFDSTCPPSLDSPESPDRHTASVLSSTNGRSAGLFKSRSNLPDCHAIVGPVFAGADDEQRTYNNQASRPTTAGAARLKKEDEPRQVDVSVIVPNYNYAGYLPERFRSILDQSVRPREVIFIDDASEDDSVEVARSIFELSDIPYRVEINETNVGPYANWKKGLALAKGAFVWIAEADDSCEPEFLETVMAPAEAAEEVVISYTQSRKIDSAGNTVSPDSLAHTDEISASKWKSSHVELGVREVVDALVYRNTIPNVSACVMKRPAAVEACSVLDSYRYCGDWAFYARMLRKGWIAYNHRSLNAFRRHEKSQTRRTFQSEDFIVEVARVRETICREFPLRLKQFSRMAYFIDKDYPVENIQSNVSHPPVARLIESAATHAENRKLIAFITTNNGSYTGGSEVLWREAAIALREAGHDVVALIKKWYPAPRFFEEFASAGIKLYFKEEGGFEKLLSLNPDLTIVSTGDQDEGTEYYGECLRRDLRYVIVNQLTKEERFWPIRPQKQDEVRTGYSNASRVFFTCRNNHRVMESRLSCGLENADYHFNPFHIDRNEVPVWPDVSPKYRFAVPSKLLYIHKGQDLLIEVLKAEKWRKRAIEVNFYGIGEDRELMERTVEELSLENVTFRGRVDDISDIWRENHALLMPSRMEGLPIMLVSAMLSARMPIVTDIGGHAELVEHSECGFIAADPDVASIDLAMEQAWAVRSDWESIGKKARQRVLEFLPDDPVLDFMSKVQHVLQETDSVRTEGP